MPGIYPQTWVGDSDKFNCEEKAYGTFMLSSKEDNGDVDISEASVVHDFSAFQRGVSEFTVEFEKGTKGAVGWLNCANEGKDSGHPHPLNESKANSIFLNISERKIFGPSTTLDENIKIDHMESTIKVICRHAHGEYSIEVVDVSPIEIAATFKESVNCLVFPMISFSGTVLVSGFKYAVDEL